MPEVIYRPARLEDSSAIQALALEAGAHHYELAPATFSEPTLESTPKPALSGEDKNSFVGVAEYEGSVGGFVFAEIAFEERKFLRRTHFVRINLVAVSASLRGRGIGKQLVAMVEQWAAAQGCTQARLNVWSVNGRAAKLYAELGYAVVVTTMSKALGNVA